MRILSVDVGTGTQDIVLYDTAEPVENALQLIMPSPTQIAARRIRRATEAGRAVALRGTIAGGGPCHWALEDHLRAGHAAYATPEAATTFDDDLENVQRMGVRLVGEDEVAALDAEQVTLRDLDLGAIRAALAAFDVPGDFDGIAAGCLDHGAAPPGYSDRLFRFDHLRRVVSERNDLRAFAYLPDEIPEYLTRARAVVKAIEGEAQVMFLDTGPAAALGALQDPAVGERDEQLFLNLGNMHALCFHLRGTEIISLYEHHTGEMSTEQIGDFTRRLMTGELRHEEVFETKGHGVYYADENQEPRTKNQGQIAVTGPQRGKVAETGLDVYYADENQEPRTKNQGQVAVTGPQRGKVAETGLDVYYAVPHGDMMASGCFGLLWAFAEKYPAAREEVLAGLGLGAR